jgi:hypothetical protein
MNLGNLVDPYYLVDLWVMNLQHLEDLGNLVDLVDR